MAYDDMASRITVMSQVIKDYRDDYDIVKVSEAVENHMRSVTTIKLFETNVVKSLGNIAGSVAASAIFGGGVKKAIVGSAIREVRSALLGRAVGPLEDLPVADYIQNRYRMLDVTTSTQTGAEHRWMAKMMQKQSADNGRGKTLRNEKLMEFDTSGGPTGKFDIQPPLVLSPVSVGDLQQARIVTEQKLTQTYEGRVNTWHPKNEYTDAWARANRPVVNDGTFKFYIKNLASNVTMAFPAYIDSVSEGSSPNWGSISLLNRSEDIYVYERAERSFDLSFYIFATNNDPTTNRYDNTFVGPFPVVVDITSGDGYTSVGVMTKSMMWDRINFLHTITRPLYGSGGAFVAAPYCRLTLGDLFKNLLVIFEDVSIDYEDLIWDLNIDTKSKDGVKPMMAKVSVNGKILHSSPPSVGTDFYKRD